MIPIEETSLGYNKFIINFRCRTNIGVLIMGTKWVLDLHLETHQARSSRSDCNWLVQLHPLCIAWVNYPGTIVDLYDVLLMNYCGTTIIGKCTKKNKQPRINMIEIEKMNGARRLRIQKRKTLVFGCKEIGWP